jgi:hypothetical protein
MTDQPARWIERAEEVILMPADGKWEDGQLDVIVAKLNADGLRRLFEAVAQDDKEGAA